MPVSNKDIEEAKKRVREMQNRANSYVNANEKSNKNMGFDGKRKQKQERSDSSKSNEQENKSPKNEISGKADDEEKGNQMFIILMLLLILSHEGADGKLLLALLYLLM